MNRCICYIYKYPRGDRSVLVEAERPEALILFLFELLVIAVQAADLNVLHCFGGIGLDGAAAVVIVAGVVVAPPAEEAQRGADARAAAKQQLDFFQRLPSRLRQEPVEEHQTHQRVDAILQEHTCQDQPNG